MSIIEQALEKSRAAGQQRVRARRATDGDSAAQYAQQAAAIDPASRIRPLAVTVDLELCRERRLLLQNVDEKDNAAVAAYRILRTRLLHRARSKGWKTIAVTSAGPNDGKTLTTLNLAFSAREGPRDRAARPGHAQSQRVPRSRRASAERARRLLGPRRTGGTAVLFGEQR
jgi:Mrp family chromosome partitioning ATPase